MDDLRKNIERIHTTELGHQRIRNNLGLEIADAVEWCKNAIKTADCTITKRGKNWYVDYKDSILTINAHSFTVITAHKKRASH